jgi:hypothetical protein
MPNNFKKTVRYALENENRVRDVINGSLLNEILKESLYMRGNIRVVFLSHIIKCI